MPDEIAPSQPINGAYVRTVKIGDEAIGYTGSRASQAEYVAVPAEHFTAKPSGAFLDFFGGGYVTLALNDLGVATQRVKTIIDFAAVEKYGVQSAGNGDATDARVLAELAELIAHGELEVPIATTCPLDDVRQAYRALGQRHTRGKGVRDIYCRQC